MFEVAWSGQHRWSRLPRAFADRLAATPWPKKKKKQLLEAKAAHMRTFRWPQAQRISVERAPLRLVEAATADAAKEAAALQQPDTTVEVSCFTYDVCYKQLYYVCVTLGQRNSMMLSGVFGVHIT
jgi:hypothetical protein